MEYGEKACTVSKRSLRATNMVKSQIPFSVKIILVCKKPQYWFWYNSIHILCNKCDDISVLFLVFYINIKDSYSGIYSQTKLYNGKKLQDF